MKSRAFAPATVANVAVGFDSLGLAIHGLGDEVEARIVKEKGVRISSIESLPTAGAEIAAIPLDTKSNTATVGVQKFLLDQEADFGVELNILKGIPLGSGLGGSAASAVAAIVAVNALLPSPLDKKHLLPYAIEGESIASGAKHADNVAPALFGGLNLIQPDHGVHSLPFPQDLRIVVVHPGFRLDTKKARAVLPDQISLQEHILASRRFAGFVAACYAQDLSLLKASLHDDIIEKARARWIAGFFEVQTAARSAGALGVSISGAGPAVFALASHARAESVRESMTLAFASSQKGRIQSWVSELNQDGARLLK